MKTLARNVGLFMFSMLASVPAMAARRDLESVSDTIAGNLGGAAQLVIQIFFLVGIILVGAGLLRLKAHKDAPQQVKLSEGITMLIIGGLLTVILGIMQIPAGTMFGDDDTNSIRAQDATRIFNR